jgi:triosephosphate isomerase
LGVQYALIGHSERRQTLGETDQIVAKKTRQALGANIIPVLCLDEPYLESQLVALEKTLINKKQLSKLVVAYEPLAAIGSGQPAQLAVVQATIQKIRQLYQPNQVLYGGSVTAENIAQFLPIADGVLVGGAALKADSFIALLKKALDAVNYAV